MKDLVSVIIPVYQVEAYVERCIRSVMTQSYDNLEIIVVDDGSTDQSGLICDRLASEDRRMQVIHQKNTGLSAARNRGLEVAKGDFIGFVDGDDFIESTMYQKLLDAIQKSDGDIAMCAYAKWLEEEGGQISCEETYAEQVLETPDVFRLFFDKKYSIMLPVAWNKLYRKKMWDSVRYPLGKRHEDEYVIHHLLHRCDRMVIIPEPLYVYRIHKGSIMTGRDVGASRDWIGALLDRASAFQRWELGEMVGQQYELCIHMILWECKKQRQLGKEEKRFIKDMGRQVRRIMFTEKQVKHRLVRGGVFACIPVLYVECDKLMRLLNITK